MNESLREQTAAFRYSLISGVVERKTPMLPGEVIAYFQEVASREYHIPGSNRTSISVRSLERYKHLYEKFGFEGLKPVKPTTRRCTGIDFRVLEEAMVLKKERPERSVQQIIFMLENTGTAKPGTVSESTLARQFRKAGLTRKELMKDGKAYGYKRFEAHAPNIRWQSDFQHTLYLPDPKVLGKRKKAILFGILDDYTRYIVHAQFYWDEKMPRMEDSLKKAILKHSIPEQFYTDNGSAFSTLHLKRVCAKLGIRLSHSAPGRPVGRGKIERFFRFIDTSFKPEAYAAIENGELTTIEDLNTRLYDWLDGYYHVRIHGSTGQTPKERYITSEKKPHKLTPMEIMEAFYWEETRKPDKTACIKVYGNIYEVDSELCMKTINIRYDPFDMDIIQVWYMGKRYGDAKPLELKTNRFPEKAASVHQDTKKSSLRFFDAAKNRRLEDIGKMQFGVEEKKNE